jgi:fructan beta-fructosidase
MNLPNMKRSAAYGLACILFFHCQNPKTTGTSVSYLEPLRPQFHFTPERNWTNDPNGLVYFDGEYHLFYQANPFGDQWGHMSWGHAISPDLVHWQHLPVAIPEADRVMVFSGSVVVDRNNTAGFGRNGQVPLVAVYTGHHETSGIQDQNLAWSLDRGRTWTKYSGNPILDIGSHNFRDPKVFWHEPGRRWIMVVALAEERRIRLYASPDLRQWTHLSDFGPAASTVGAWECPDLFEVTVDNDPGLSRWVLHVNVNSGAPAGGSGGQYFVGEFDGRVFKAEHPKRTNWTDYGKDFYAAVSWSDVPEADGRRIWIGWMSNWQYADRTPTSPWRGAMTVPRTLSLGKLEDGYCLVQKPVEELTRLRGRHFRLESIRIGPSGRRVADRAIDGAAYEIIAEFRPGTDETVGLKIRMSDREQTLVGYDVKSGELFVDRRRSGPDTVASSFPGRHAAPLSLVGGTVRLHVFVDWSSVEVFGNHGERVVTDLFFPGPGSGGLELYAKQGTADLVSLDVWGLGSIW